MLIINHNPEWLSSHCSCICTAIFPTASRLSTVKAHRGVHCGFQLKCGLRNNRNLNDFIKCKDSVARFHQLKHFLRLTAKNKYMQNHCDCSWHGLGCASSSFLFPIFPVCLVVSVLFVSLALSLTGDSYLSHSPVKPCCIYTKLYCLFPSRALIACQPACSTLDNFILFGAVFYIPVLGSTGSLCLVLQCLPCSTQFASHQPGWHHTSFLPWKNVLNLLTLPFNNIIFWGVSGPKVLTTLNSKFLFYSSSINYLFLPMHKVYHTAHPFLYSIFQHQLGTKGLIFIQVKKLEDACILSSWCSKNLAYH